VRKAWQWVAAWFIPGLGMFSEAYIIFSLGLTRPFQKALYPACFVTHEACAEELTHVQNYIQICGIIVGMLAFGVCADFIGRKWGSRIVASIMLSGTILLTFTPFTPNPYSFLAFYIFAATWYGFGVGGEYPLASASAAERSQADPALRNHRGQQVVLTFSQQGFGNLVNGCVILICMLIFGQTGTLTPKGSQGVLSLQFAFGAAISLFMVVWRYTKLEESGVWSHERADFEQINQSEKHSKGHLYTVTIKQ
jgi:Na+/melibiose symporter-like transporter